MWFVCVSHPIDLTPYLYPYVLWYRTGTDPDPRIPLKKITDPDPTFIDISSLLDF
jgi:hypothetical protein